MQQGFRSKSRTPMADELGQGRLEMQILEEAEPTATKLTKYAEAGSHVQR